MDLPSSSPPRRKCRFCRYLCKKLAKLLRRSSSSSVSQQSSRTLSQIPPSAPPLPNDEPNLTSGNCLAPAPVHPVIPAPQPSVISPPSPVASDSLHVATRIESSAVAILSEATDTSKTNDNVVDLTAYASPVSTTLPSPIAGASSPAAARIESPGVAVLPEVDSSLADALQPGDASRTNDRVTNLTSYASPLTSTPPSPAADASPIAAPRIEGLSVAVPSEAPEPSRTNDNLVKLTTYPSPVSTAPPSPVAGPSPAAAPRDEPPVTVISPEPTDTSKTEGNEVESTAFAGPVPPQRVLSEVWAGLETALQGLREGIELFPPLQNAIHTFITCLDVLEETSSNLQECGALATQLRSPCELLAEHMKQSSLVHVTSSIANISRSITEHADLIEKKRGRRTARPIAEVKRDEVDISWHCRQIQFLFQQLQIEANLTLWDIFGDPHVATRLERLKPVMSAKHNSTLATDIGRRTCTAGTRTELLSGLNAWSQNPDAAGLYWMNGEAGTGKTTIACAFAEILENRKQLAASFFCTRATLECQDVTRIIPTIAYQLAQHSVPFQSALFGALGEDPDVGSRNIEKQFERLLKKPLLEVKEAISKKLVIVIDGLHESSNMREVELLLSIFLRFGGQLPLKVFVTCRSQLEIYERTLARVPGAEDMLHLHHVEKSPAQADIQLYLAEQLEPMSPTPSILEELAQRSGDRFIYAATLVRYIRPCEGSIDSHQRLQSLLILAAQPGNMHPALDELYEAILQAVLDVNHPGNEAEDAQLVLWAVVCIREPVGIETLAILTGLNNGDKVMTALESLRSVIHFSPASGLVSTLHTSFPEFMFNPARSQSYLCNPAKQSELLARRCFEVMKLQLKFNICDLESSYVPDSKVQDLDDRVRRAISPPLWYACRYWSSHLQQTGFSDQLCTILVDFLSVWLLFWIEVLNLKRDLVRGSDALIDAIQWLKMNAPLPDVTKLIDDAHHFLTSVASSPASRSTPHIYISLLPFCPKSSMVFKHFSNAMPGLMKVTGSILQKREIMSVASWQTEYPVSSAVYSPDGAHLAFGSDDNTIHIWRAHDGRFVAGPLEGHTSRVSSVAYSLDGTRLVSGSNDKTIRVWRADDGTLIAGPLKGHTAGVTSVAFSPDGSCIASGSNDKTIRVWSVRDGRLAVGPMKGHSDKVTSVAYSPGSTHIVSGSWDRTIQVWSARDGMLVAGPFKGHTNRVLSVAYSPDGANIASGCDDNIIQVWSASSGRLVAGPFRGHTRGVCSVTYSPDGTRIASGSLDKTILVWSPHDGRLIAGPFEGHGKRVTSVAFSPDSTHIVSGSWDKTVRVWRVHDGTPVLGSSEGHTKKINSVAPSPDGIHIASCSDDNTIRVWRVCDGTLVAGPFQGHTGRVAAVAYSCDGAHIVSGSNDKTIRVWNGHDGMPIAGPMKGHTDGVTSVAFSPDGSCIASGSNDNTIRVWSEHDSRIVAAPLKGHTNRVTSVAYSPDGTRIVSGAHDNSILIWGTQDGALVAGPIIGHTAPVTSLACSPDGSYAVSGSDDRTIRVWNTFSGELVAGPFRGHTRGVSSVAYSPDGTYVVSGSNDKTIRVWSTYDGKCIAGPFQGHTELITSVSFTPDGNHLVSSSWDNTIRVWRANDNTLIGGISGQGDSLSSHHAPRRRIDLRDGVIGPDGWVVYSYYQLLCWLPPEFTKIGVLPTIHNPLIITPHGSFGIDFSDFCCGTRWHHCYNRSA